MCCEISHSAGEKILPPRESQGHESHMEEGIRHARYPAISPHDLIRAAVGRTNIIRLAQKDISGFTATISSFIADIISKGLSILTRQTHRQKNHGGGIVP